ncbi:MAG: hypothetical protein HY220_04320 [Candidatus Sungbacteria bacterium]|uniref:Uncharacterized protein n=1 Tax=Candidatus Sungiibacteriota bacterium TaxID=2750080 RepID=A0A9D6LUM4_9BACT|nr:hypothetical protein [Candidatus Sungbacteria bacterium]
MTRWLWAVKFLVVLGAGIGFGFYIRSQTLNPRALIPKIVERTLSYSVQQGETEDDDLLYYDTDLATFITHGSKKTKVTVEGVVNIIAPQPDGDFHVVIKAPDESLLVTEFIPEIKNLPLPTAGDRIKIWGIVRFDTFHNWWELHPVIGWQKI